MSTDRRSSPRPERVAVLGCGQWGSTLALKLAGQGARVARVALWEFDPARAAAVARTRSNQPFLPAEARLPEEVLVTSDGPAALEGADVVVVALPTTVLRGAVRALAPAVPPRAVVVSVAKGVEFETGCRLTQVLAQELSTEGAPARAIAALSGPNLALEVLRDLPSSAVVASTDEAAALRVQALMASPAYRVYWCPDVVGVELGGALKNVVAIAAGIVDGLGFGDNTKSALMTRGLAELARFGVRHGADPMTFLGLSGVGDLIATCSSRLSRNHTCGRLLAAGKDLAAIGREMTSVAEGVNTTRSVHRWAAELGVSMPITDALHGVLFEGRPVREAVQALMTRELKREDEFGALAKAPRH